MTTETKRHSKHWDVKRAQIHIAMLTEGLPQEEANHRRLQAVYEQRKLAGDARGMSAIRGYLSASGRQIALDRSHLEFWQKEATR